jgi:vacuolar-type H+-ATPase subunit I/STV1
LPLQQIISSYVEKQRQIDRDREEKEREERLKRMKQSGNDQEDMDFRNSKTVQNILRRAPRDKLPEIEDYIRDYRRCMARKKIIENAAQESTAELNEILRHESKAKEHLYNFQEQASELTEKIQTMQQELEKIQKKQEEQTEVVRKTHHSNI